MNIWYELSYTLRSIRKKIGFSALCVVVIAMGYSITLPIYSIVKNFAYSTVAFPEGHRLAFIRQTNFVRGFEYDAASFDFYQFNAIRANATSYEDLGAYRDTRTTLSDGDSTQRFNGVEITVDAFALSSIQPILGRGIQTEDAQPGATPVVVISHFVWQSYYGSASDIIGKQSRVNGEPRTIVGVMPEDYTYPSTAEVWLPLPINNAAEPDRREALAVIGKLADGVNRSEANVELTAIMSSIQESHENYDERSAKVTPYIQGFISNALGIFNSIGGLGICILILICLNVGNLLLIRTNERIAELAVRSAVGASRFSLVKHLLLESLLICLMGACLGLIAAAFVLDYLQFLFFDVLIGARELPFWFDFTLNTQAVLFGLAMMFCIWLATGLFTAWLALKQEVATVLSSHSKSTGLRENGRVSRLLVHFQITLSFFLLVISGSYLFALQSNYDSVIVADSDRIIRGNIDFDLPGYDNNQAKYDYIQNLRSQLETLTEIESISFGSAAPGYVSGVVSASVNGSDSTTGEEPRRYGLSAIDIDYFQNANIPILQGRIFDSLDSEYSEPVVIVSQRFLITEGIEEDALGQLIDLQPVFGDSESTTARIVGVVPALGVEDRDYPTEVYRPLTQLFPDSILLLAKLHDGITSPVSELEQTIQMLAQGVDRDIPIYSMGFLIQEIERNNSATRFFISIFSAAAIGALILAIIGVYGLISRSVLAQTAEIGIRRAIGSSNTMIFRIFLRQALRYLTVGTIFGGGAALIGVNIVNNSSGSFDLLAAIFVVFVAVTLIVGTLVGYASYVPVRRAIAIEPGEALHYE